MPSGILAVVRDVRIWCILARYSLVSGSGLALNSMVFSVLYATAHFPLWLAAPGAVELAIVYNFVLDNRWTFGRKDVSLGRFTKYNASSLAGLIITVPMVWVLVHGLGLHYLLANLLGQQASGLVNLAGIAWAWGLWPMALRFPRRYRPPFNSRRDVTRVGDRHDHGMKQKEPNSTGSAPW